jgi:hypothetical protein
LFCSLRKNGPLLAKMSASSRLLAAILQQRKKSMRKALLIGVVLTMMTGLANAQAAREHRGFGYGFGAPGASIGDGDATGTLHFGLGGERLVYKGLGAGGEVGYLGPMTEMSEGIGIGSANGSYHFRNATSSGKVEPFITGGYSLAFRNDVASGFNVGRRC